MCTRLLWLCLFLFPAFGQDAFVSEIQPILKRYCLTCHSAARHSGDLNLERFTSTQSVLADTRPWQKLIEQINLGEMPPKAMPQPARAERARLLSWTESALRTAARASAGDPGPVVLRRLNNAEYTFTIRDLTGVSTLDPAREFPADGAAGEGFLNTGNALSMSPALVAKYLDAAKRVAANAVLLPDGVRFSPSASRPDWTTEILSEIRAFYAEHSEAGGAEHVTQQGVALDRNRGGGLALRKYITASLALRGANADVAAVARRYNVSPKYLQLLTGLLKGTRRSPLLDELRTRWRAATPADVDGLVAGIDRWRETLWRFSSVGHIGKADGPKAWMEPVTPVAATQEFRVKLAGGQTKIYLVAHDAGDGAQYDHVIWRAPKLVMEGRPPILVRDIPAFVSALSSRRAQVLGTTATFDSPAWRTFLALDRPAAFPLARLAKRIEKIGEHEFVKGFGSPQGPMVIANKSDREVRVPGRMKAMGVALHPAATQFVAAGWRSPAASVIDVSATLTRANPECGNGVTWSIELRRGAIRLRLAEGELRSAAPLTIKAVERLPVQPGDLLSVVIGPRDGNHSCDLTAVDLRFGDAALEPASLGSNEWHFYTENSPGFTIPSDSLLARWLLASAKHDKEALAIELHKLLNGSAPAAGPDAQLHRQLTSLASPLYIGEAPSIASAAPADVSVQAPTVMVIDIPADLAAQSEFVTTGMLDPARGAEGSVQLEVLTAPGKAQSRILPAGTTTSNGQGMWTSNNQAVNYAMPVIVNSASTARIRVEAAMEEFRQMFPAALCYTKIVPVDEVVTLTLYHREDEHLRRLVLDAKQAATLDRLWNELRYVSRDALTLVDAFEQLWQYATQDADPSKFEPMRQPILQRAAAFRDQLAASEPRHVDAVIQLAGRAYRRPLTNGESAQLRSFYRQLRDQATPHEEAVRLLIARVLVSPAFLYRAETAGPSKQPVAVNGYELASRLSYFLWSSLPDDELRAAAASGALRTPAGLRVQTRRMLADGRIRRLASEFGAAWLHLQGFESLDEKSERYFPSFRELRGPMYEETLRFFTDLFQANGSVLSVVDADHTFLNDALAKHYGIAGVTGAEWRRVDGVKSYARGGVLGQASVLSKQAGASRTSPILRGNWIAEVLLGDKLPRPPKDVPPLPADEDATTLTMREMTERHTKDPRCSGCHARVDPYGYAMEGFDAIGRWRRIDSNGRPIHDRATLRDGAVIEGAAGLRQYLLTTGRPAFLRQFSRKLLGYALGRAVQLSDEPLLEEMQTGLAANRYHVGVAVDAIVNSRQFQEIRGRNHE